MHMHAGPSSRSQAAPKLSGSTPGVLDHTQAERLCRHPGSKLSFASFDPHTASSNRAVPGLDDLSLHKKLYRPKRVVIETTPSGESSWRFVPSARREKGVTNEGKWPRVVDICGKHFETSQEQWDIYKLDPLYDCLVGTPPAVPAITRVTEHLHTGPPPASGQKRRVSSPSEDSFAHSPKPRKRKVEIQTESEDEQSQVQDMIIDDGLQRPKSAAGPSDRAKKSKEKIAADRKERQERTTRRMERLFKQENGEAEFTFTAPAAASTSASPPAIGKRKVTSLFNTLRTNGDHDNTETTRSTEEEPLRNTINYVPTKDAKRTRTVSPSAAKRNLAAGRHAREKHKSEHRRQEQEARRLAKEAELLEELYRNNPDVDMPDASQGIAGTGSDSDDEESEDVGNEIPSSGDVADDEEAARQAAIAESRRKLAELEADRPLWEAAAAERKEQERREAEARRQEAEAKKRAEERERAAKEKRELEEQWRREEEEAYRKAREEAARRYDEQEKIRYQGAKRERDSWSRGHWTVERAKERYNKLAERFDKTKYSPEEVPLTAVDIPWPMLARDFDLEDVTWQAVAEFFNSIQPTMTTMEFKKFIIKSHLRFHTDRWASRRLLESVKDEAERGCIEIANKMVIQQLTPIWEGVCGKKAEHTTHS